MPSRVENAVTLERGSAWYSTLSKAFQEGQQLVSGSVATRVAVDRRGLREGLRREREPGVQSQRGGGHRLVSTPRRDDRPVDATVPQGHRGAVAPARRREPFTLSGGAALRRGGDVGGQQRGHAITAPRSTASVGKHRRFWAMPRFTRPRASRADRVLRQGDAPPLATWAMTTPVRPRAEGAVLPAESEPRGDAPTGLDRHQPQGPVAPTGPCLGSGCRHERVDRGAGPPGDGRAVITLTGAGQDAWDHATGARCLQRRIVEHRGQRRQAHSAATGAGTARVFPIRQQRAAHRGIPIGQCQG
jgi:hypothetical protein